MTTEQSFDHRETGTDEATWAALPDWANCPPLQLGGISRAVVLSAHPDDETLGVGGLIADLTSRGIPVTVVVATRGEASHPHSPTHSPEELAALRDAELGEALQELAAGSSAPELRSLQLPDGKLTEHADELTAALRAATVLADTDRAVPAGENEAETEAGLLLLSPWSHDGHPDHEICGQVTARLADELTTGGQQVQHLMYPIWLWHWGSGFDLPWSQVRLHELPPETRSRKRAALARHRSQVEALSPAPGDEPIVSPEMLAHFDRPAETFLAAGEQAARVRETFDRLHTAAPDPWQVDSAWYERRKRDVLLASLPERRYRLALDIGCSTGALAAELALRCEQLVATDVSPVAVDAARRRLAGLPGTQVRIASVPDEWPVSDPDLVVLSESGYYLTSLQLELLIRRLGQLSPGATLVACHYTGPIMGWELDGHRVHQRLAQLPGWTTVVSHRDDGFLLDVLVCQGPA